MDHREYKIEISASAQKVWFVLWDDHHYRRWTSAFTEGSYAVGSWETGGKIHFLMPNGRGMYSEIERCEPPNAMIFKHLGEIKDFEEQAPNEETKKWAGYQEAYSLVENQGVTSLSVKLDVIEEYQAFFDQTFPSALNNVKKLTEDLQIVVTTEVNATADVLWKLWNTPADIIKWNAASADWHTVSATNDLQKGGKIEYRMEAKDGSFGFDFLGVYAEVQPNHSIEYAIADGRNVKIEFIETEGVTKIIETFQAEGTNPPELQRNGWQAILNNFKCCVESETL